MQGVLKGPKSTIDTVVIVAGDVFLEGMLCLPKNAPALVVFVHGSGSSRFSQRNQFLADELNREGMGTLLFDLLTHDEVKIDKDSRRRRLNIELLASRVVETTVWLSEHPETADLPIGYFGASTGAAAALEAAAKLPRRVKAVVSRGGRPDLAADFLWQVKAPTLLIVGAEDPQGIGGNQAALELMPAATKKKIEIIPGATHLFEEPGTLELASVFACRWFQKYLIGGR